MNKSASCAVAVALVLSGTGALRGAILEETTVDVYPLSATGTVSIRNADGRINVYGSEEPQLKVKAVRRAFTKERLKEIKVDVVINGDSAAIETSFPPMPKGSILADRSGTVDYTILVPQTCTLSKVELANGEIVVEGVFGGGIDARLGNGRMELFNCFSTTRLSLGQGGLDVRYNWWEAKAFSLSADVANGDIRFDLPPDAVLGLDVATVKGHITNTFAADKQSDARAVTTRIGGEGPAEFRLRTTNGNVRIEKTY